jgi:hypothetical protein
MTLLYILLLAASVAVGQEQDGAIEGTFFPPDAKATVTAVSSGGAGTMTSAGRNGRFRLSLRPGTYSLVVSAPVSSFPIRFDGITVLPGETTTLPEVLIVAGSGKATLSGRTIPALSDSEIVLLREGREQARSHTDRSGAYLFKDLAAGSYEVRAEAPGHAMDRIPIAVPENQRVRQTAVLFPIDPVPGVDWAAGTVRAKGVGLLPKDAPNAAAARALAERAALVEAERNLLLTIERIRIDGSRTVRDSMATKSGALRVQGYLKGFRKVGERELPDGSIEVTLELLLTGARGLSRAIPDE